MYGFALYVHPKLTGFQKDTVCQLRFLFFRCIAEIRFGRPYVSGIRHRIFAGFGDAEIRIFQFPAFLSIQMIMVLCVHFVLF